MGDVVMTDKEALYIKIWKTMQLQNQYQQFWWKVGCAQYEWGHKKSPKK